MADERVRIEIGFEGGGVLGENVSNKVADAFEAALKEGRELVHELTFDDGHYLIELGRVLYVKRHTRESRIGF